MRCCPRNAVALVIALTSAQIANAQILWSSAGGSAWLTSSNWTGGAVPTGSQIAQFGINPTGASGVGINFNGTTNAGTQVNGQKIQEVGAVEITSGRATAIFVGNSSSTSGATGQFRLNGVTVNGVANTIIRNNSTQTFTIQNTQNTGNQTMSLILGNATDNVVNIDGTGDVAISSVVTGTGGGLTLNGNSTGILILSGANTYSGGTTINTGTLQVGNGGASGTLGSGAVTNNGTLSFSRSDNPVVANNISGTGALRAMSSVTLTGANSYSGVTTIDSGATIQVGAGGTVGTLGSGDVVNNGTLSFNRTNAVTVANNIGGTGVVVQNGAGGVTTLSGTNSYTGTTTVSAGTLLFNTTGSLYGGNAGNWTDTNIVVNSGGVLAVTLGGANGFSATQAQAISQLGTTIGGFKSGSYFGIDTSNGDQTYSNVIADTNTSNGPNKIGFVKLGANILTLTATNTYFGGSTSGTRIVGGTLQLGDGGSTGSLGGTNTVSISSGATLAINRNNALGIGNAIIGQGGVTQMGTGTTALAGTNTYSGATNVTAGTLLINGNQSSATGAVTVSGGTLGGKGTIGGATTVQSGGTIEAGSAGIGTLNINNNLTIQNGGTARVQIGTGTGASDTLNLSGGTGTNTLSLVSGSNLTLVNSGFDATGPTTYTLANLGPSGILLFDGNPIPQNTDLFTFSASGNYGGLNVNLIGFTGGEQFTLRRTTDSISLVFSPVPEPASLLAVCGLVVGGVVAVRKLRRKAVPAEVTPAA